MPNRSKKNRGSTNRTEATSTLIKSLEKLSNEIVIDPERLAEFVKAWQNGFHHYSLNNLMLIYSQKPDATLCASYHAWHERNRYVKSGEKGLAILAPIIIKKRAKDDETDPENVSELVRWFKVVYTFDISQTDGEALELAKDSYIAGTSKLSLSQVSNLFPEYKVNFKGQNTTAGSTDGETFITLAASDNQLAMISTYLHEVGHCKLGHGNGRKDTPRELKELEAEAVSYIVGEYLGIDNKQSGLYIGQWRGSQDKLGKAGSQILKTAEQICRKLGKLNNPDGQASAS